MKVTFLTIPRLDVDGKDAWVLVDPFDVRIDDDYLTPPTYITIPAGFKTDLASVPRLPGAYLLFGGRARRSAILHDYLYSMQYPRAWADQVFRVAAENETGAFVRWMMWAGVRVFGGTYYRSHTETEINPTLKVDP